VEWEGFGECLAEGLEVEDLEGDEGGVFCGGFGEVEEGRRCEEAWMERRRAIRSEASLAALRARVRGIIRRDWANSPMASCSREPCAVVFRRGGAFRGGKGRGKGAVNEEQGKGDVRL